MGEWSRKRNGLDWACGIVRSPHVSRIIGAEFESTTGQWQEFRRERLGFANRFRQTVSVGLAASLRSADQSRKREVVKVASFLLKNGEFLPCTAGKPRLLATSPRRFPLATCLHRPSSAPAVRPHLCQPADYSV